MKKCNEDKAVARLAELLALECGIHPVTARRIFISAELHDIGKMKIPEYILNKPGKLTENEIEIMKTHTVLGAEILSGLKGELGYMAKTICLFHHEHQNGGGYFKKLADELPVYVAVVAISDVYIALTSERAYKRAWTHGEAIDYIKKQAGTQFNPVLVESFLSLMQDENRVPALLLYGKNEYINGGLR